MGGTPEFLALSRRPYAPWSMMPNVVSCPFTSTSTVAPAARTAETECDRPGAVLSPRSTSVFPDSVNRCSSRLPVGVPGVVVFSVAVTVPAWLSVH